MTAGATRGLELLTPAEMAEADRQAIEAGPFDGFGLMRNAGASVAAEILRRWPGAARVDVLCGPGNNGGDGYVVARLLAEAGVAVGVWALGAPKPGTDAHRAARENPVAARPLKTFRPAADGLVVDALFGAGLSRPLEGAAAAAADACAAAEAAVVAIDLPSGVSGETGRPTGACFAAALTVTFFRPKPGHFLQPGRALCGETLVTDIGIAADVPAARAAKAFVNRPGLWRHALPRPAVGGHKYDRGHVGVFTGGATATGAGRLAALAAARSGAGAVTVLAPGDALAVNAAHLTAIMLRQVDGSEEARAFVAERRPAALVLGPGFGVGERLRDIALAVIEAERPPLLVLDADGITSFRDAPASLFIAAGADGGPPRLVLTPHEGEFSRLFPGLASDAALSKLERARRAASRAHAVVVLKGPDTVIAAPDGRAAINENGVPWLATAGSGDVLAGIIAGFCAQGMSAWEAACAAVWMHAEAAARFGPGLIAEDLPGALPPVLREQLEGKG